MTEFKIKQRVNILLKAGEITADFISFEGKGTEKEHIGIYFEGTEKKEGTAPLVRLHSECLTGDVFSSARCDCGDQLDEAIDLINKEGGYIMYLRQEGRGIGLYAKLDAYALQDQGYDTYQANEMLHMPQDDRDFGVAADMLKALEANTIRLLTNNPDKAQQLKDSGIDVVEVVPTQVHVHEHNRKYLETKAERKAHTIHFED
ncbi:GTP cyclohydrolase II [Marinomonas sp. C2222]|uniref:GTP cyclohydrolase-2 n=1 Tax=Marinomonas sargassi TaxID=2984494 RepID=A0ABT2YSI1_9GAMM|nr:GTP cyclohydrolase II [Marinomonas sargassi]MCV2402853.1 GTP cyclohydrolase II [Marinomonas sargassi]